MFENKTVLITGCSGSWGKELVKQLLNLDVKEIRSFARGEFSQVTLSRIFNNPKLKIIIGDVRDYEALNTACKDVDIVLHLAALKHVPICEEQPEEAIKTNINGTLNVIKACINQGVSRCVDVSTDKACSPNNLYGMTKAVGEKLIYNANKFQKTAFLTIRCGNILGSAGSVVPLFISQITKHNSMTVTDCSMTRYFMSLPEAIELLIKASSAPRGSLLVMKMPSCTIGNLADTMGYIFGDEITTIREVGARPGEKLHEMLISENEAPLTYVHDENYYIISEDELDLPKVDFKYYSSNSQPLMDKSQITEMLMKGGFLK